MKIDFDVKDIFQNCIATSWGLDKYDFIMREVKNTNVATDVEFQRVFDGFYRVRRNAAWRKVYFNYFEKAKKTKPLFGDIIAFLYEKTGNIEPSFSSKMLATISPNKPIWDQYVLSNLGMKLTGKNNYKKVERAINLYSNIEEWYEEFLSSQKGRECIAEFDRMLPNYSHISDVKKIDCFVWSNR